MCLVQFDKFFTISKVCEHNDTMGLNWPCKIDLPRHEWHNHVFSPVTLSGFINTLYNAYVVSVTIFFPFSFLWVSFIIRPSKEVYYDSSIPWRCPC